MAGRAFEKYDLSCHCAADEVARALAEAGIREIFGQSCPTALMFACDKLGIAQIGYRTENAGAAMADGFARVSGRIGCVAAQNGPAATLLVPGLAEALKASVPILALVQDVSRSTIGRNAFQEFDHRALFSSCSVWFDRLAEPARAYELTRKAITAATTGRPGPAVLMLPIDVLPEQVEKQVLPLVPGLGRFPLLRSRPDRDAVASAAICLREAKRPLVVAGGGVHSADAHEVLARLQDRFAVPVATTNMGKGAVDERHSLSVGVVGSVMGTGSPAQFMADFIKQADLILFVGTRTNENGTASWTLFPSSATYLHIDVDPAETQRNYPAAPLVGDARATLEALEEELDRSVEQIDAEIAQRFRRLAGEIAARKEQGRRSGVSVPERGGLRPESVMETLQESAPARTIFVADASYATLWMTQFVEARGAGRRFISPRGLAGLGWGYPMALGAKLAHPQECVVAIVGDGGFAHCWAELECAVRHGIGVTVIVLNNGVLGFQRNAEIARFGKYTDVCEMRRVDHTMVAKAVGCAAHAASSTAELEAALSVCFASKGPSLIDVVVDPHAFPPITAFEAQRTEA